MDDWTIRSMLFLEEDSPIKDLFNLLKPDEEVLFMNAVTNPAVKWYFSRLVCMYEKWDIFREIGS